MAAAFTSPRQPVAAAGPFDRPALVDRVGKIQPVVGRHAVCEGARQFLAHLGQRPEAVRLEHDQEPTRVRAQRRHAGSDLVGVMREIVDDGHSAGFADRLEPSPQAAEATERRGRVGD